MNDDDAYLLILEDNELISSGLKRWVKERFPRKKVMVARTIAEAQLFFSEIPIDFFILDIMLPDGNGIDFLCDVRMVKPNARVIVQTATPLPEYKSKAAELGTIRFMEKPIDLAQLEQELRRHLTSDPDPRPCVLPAESGGVQAVLESFTLMDIVQLKCLSRCSVALEFTRPSGERGLIYFKSGEIVHAETSEITGILAFASILGWKHGRVCELKSAPPPMEESIDLSWQMLLMEASQAIDEGRTSDPGSQTQTAA